jgi:hypothetical protein
VHVHVHVYVLRDLPREKDMSVSPHGPNTQFTHQHCFPCAKRSLPPCSTFESLILGVGRMALASKLHVIIIVNSQSMAENTPLTLSTALLQYKLCVIGFEACDQVRRE